MGNRVVLTRGGRPVSIRWCSLSRCAQPGGGGHRRRWLDDLSNWMRRPNRLAHLLTGLGWVGQRVGCCCPVGRGDCGDRGRPEDGAAYVPMDPAHRR
ncbi:hypothetical protein I553_2779, partial [Mycobacterium xenopi 4042]